MLSDAVKFTTPQENMTDKVPADIYQVVLVDVEESEGTDFNTGEPKKQLKFFAEIVEGDEIGKIVSFYTSFSWFNGGKNAKPSKLFNLVKTIYSYYKKDISVGELPVVEAKDVNELIGCQIRVTVDETEKGWPKVTAFTPIKKEIEYTSKPKKVDEVDIDEIPDFDK